MNTIEKSIQQTKPFKNSIQRAIVNIIYSGNTIAHSMDKQFSIYGLSQKQYNVLRILRGANGNISTAQVKERMLVKNADASRIVDRLVQKGLLSKCPNNNDKRQISISITEKGHEILIQMENELDQVDQLIKNMTEKELIQLNNLLDKFRTNFNH